MGTWSWVGWDTLTVSTRIEIFIFKHVVLHIHTVATVFHLFRISEITRTVLMTFRLLSCVYASFRNYFRDYSLF